MAGKVSEIESHAGYWLRFVSNHVTHAFRLKVESHGVTVAEWVVLRTLFDRAGANPSQVAEAMGMTRGAISRLIERLVAKRLALCRLDRSDRRYQLVTLSAKGRRLVPILAKLADQNDGEFFGHLPQEQRDALVATLRRVIQQHGLKSVPIN